MEDALKKYYYNEGYEDLRISKENLQYTEFLTLIKYLEKVLPKESKILDPCAGTGVYSFHLADQGHRVTAGDLFDININILKEKEQERLVQIEKSQSKRKALEKIYLGDVRDLSDFPDESFDCVLCMGALYHMHEESERNSAVEECLRVLKKSGIFVATYINRLAAILGNCHGDIEDIEEVLGFLKTGIEGVFYTHMPTEIDDMMESFQLNRLFHIGVDGVGYLLYGNPPIITYEGLLKWRKLHFATCEVREILGYSYHGAYFGRKLDDLQ